jgi:hypothetical protein
VRVLADVEELLIVGPSTAKLALHATCTSTPARSRRTWWASRPWTTRATAQLVAYARKYFDRADQMA